MQGYTLFDFDTLIEQLPGDISVSYLSGESKDFKENQSSILVVFAFSDAGRGTCALVA
ncbi:hypothetical protein O9929_05490 [Vibrio lentus]|nr:hypothetical protein [Vibrio lentus]